MDQPSDREMIRAKQLEGAKVFRSLAGFDILIEDAHDPLESSETSQ